jgi:hypothetical protein
VDELENHISQFCEYNDIDDVDNVLLGKLESIQGVTTKQQDPEFGPEVNN